MWLSIIDFSWSYDYLTKRVYNFMGNKNLKALLFISVGISGQNGTTGIGNKGLPFKFPLPNDNDGGQSLLGTDFV